MPVNKVIHSGFLKKYLEGYANRVNEAHMDCNAAPMSNLYILKQKQELIEEQSSVCHYHSINY